MAGENAKVHHSQSPDVLTVESGGSIDIKSGGKITASGTQAAAITALTDNSGGTPSATIAAISDTATKNAVASIAANLNALALACKNAGITA